MDKEETVKQNKREICSEAKVRKVPSEATLGN